MPAWSRSTPPSAALIAVVVVLLLGGLVMSQFGGTRGRQKVWNQSGAALPYVMDVERALIEELKIYPVFTGDPKPDSP